MLSANAGKRVGQLAFSLTLEEKDLYSLDRFHEGDYNTVPLGAAKLFGKNDGGQEMPRSLVITGPEGSGKSHLLKGLYRNFVAGKGGSAAAKAAIIDAANIGSGDDAVQKLKMMYGYDLVCIDSLDAAKGGEEFYEGVFNLYNEIIGNGGYFAVAMRRSPAKAPGMPDFLYTRLLSGMVVRIKRPGDKEKMGILAKLAADRQISLSPQGIKYILERSGRTVGLLAKLIARLENELGKKGGKAGLQLIRSVIDSA
jgi:chromosomal replication initiation ATPase DnaA